MKTILNFEIERGKPIDQYRFAVDLKLTDSSKNLLDQELGDFSNLDDYFTLNHNNFYIYHNKSEYVDRNELYVKNNNGKYLKANFPLDNCEFSVEFDGDSIIDYGLYHRSEIDNEKVFDDQGEFLSIIQDLLNSLLKNIKDLTVQDVLLQMHNEIASKEMEVEREKRQVEQELSRKNEEFKELVEKGEITLFKIVKGQDIDNTRSAAVLLLDSTDIVLDADKFYIAEYENREFLHCVTSERDMLLDYKDLHFALSNNSEFKSGFYTVGSNYFHFNNKFLDENEISKILSKVSNSLKEEDEEEKVNEIENEIVQQNLFEQSKKVVKRSIQEELENDYPAIENIELNNNPMKTEQSNWNIFNFIKNTFSSFFSSIFNWFTVDHTSSIDAEFPQINQASQDITLGIEENYNNNDHNLI